MVFITSQARNLNEQKKHQRRTKQILIVDDQNVDALRLGRLFERYGYGVVVTHGVSEALIELKDIHPDAVISDVVLGSNTSAIDIVGDVRKYRPRSSIICYSGLQQSLGMITEAKRLCDVFLEKPFSDEVMIETVERAISDRRDLFLREEELENMNMGAEGKEKTAGEESGPDPNRESFIRERSYLEKEFYGQYVAYINGERVLITPDRKSLIRKVIEKFKTTNFYYKRIDSQSKPKRFRSPRRLK